MQLKDTHKGYAGLNSDDAPSFLQNGEMVDALNVRVAGSSSQHGAGNIETLQGEIPILFDVVAAITYYGSAVGGDFFYSGYEEVLINGKVWMKKNWDYAYPGSKAYDDDEDNADVYGRLYTHDQIMAADFCPPGWHVPTEAEWDDLLTYLGGVMIAGGKLKETGLQHWQTPNTDSLDVAAFTALPAGKFDEAFSLLEQYGMFWMVEDGEPTPPIAINASETTPVSFKANWLAVSDVTGYYLDVATDAAFTAMVAGFDNLDVGNVLVKEVTGLSPLTPYYYRLRAYNEVGAGINSNTITKTTLDGVTDADGNVYSYITIGTQQWMVENWKSTKYADGTAIPNVTVDADWEAEDGTPGHDGALCYYDNDIAYKPVYGALYNWHAVDNAHGLAPVGWRVPSETDLNTLASFLGGYAVSAGKLKETGIAHWQTPNLGAVDTYRFKGLPSGQRSASAIFRHIYQYNYTWSATDTDAANAKYIDMYYNSIDMALSINDKRMGLAIRMMRDTP